MNQKVSEIKKNQHYFKVTCESCWKFGWVKTPWAKQVISLFPHTPAREVVKFSSCNLMKTPAPTHLPPVDRLRPTNLISSVPSENKNFWTSSMRSLTLRSLGTQTPPTATNRRACRVWLHATFILHHGLLRKFDLPSKLRLAQICTQQAMVKWGSFGSISTRQLSGILLPQTCPHDKLLQLQLPGDFSVRCVSYATLQQCWSAEDLMPWISTIGTNSGNIQETTLGMCLYEFVLFRTENKPDCLKTTEKHILFFFGRSVPLSNSPGLEKQAKARFVSHLHSSAQQQNDSCFHTVNIFTV